MEQLKMYLLPGTVVPEPVLPEGYSISNYACEADRDEWCACCGNGHLIDEMAGRKPFEDTILAHQTLDPYRDLFFLDYGGQHIATATCYINGQNEGDLHMVGMRTEYRGRGLAKYIVCAAVNHQKDAGAKYIFLTTDEFRKTAIRSYLKAGFLPVDYAEDMEARWIAVLRDLDIAETVLLNNDGTVKKRITK